MAVLVVAALSARLMAQAAARDGFEVVALDLFGDADTRRASAQWLPIGEPATMRLSPDQVLAALHGLADRRDAVGWVAGAGFEGMPGLLAEGANVLPLLGTPAAAVRRVRDPAEFFGFLAAQGIDHPEVRWVRPADAHGWLLKDARGSGGWHIRHAATQGGEAAPEHHYFQREAAGTPMSATFVANGREACLLDFNEQIVRRLGGRPFVYCGVVGPVPLPAGLAARVARTLRHLVAEFGLRGLGSLDFLRDGDDVQVLEVNPRPPASIALYDEVGGRGTMAAHVAACLQGELPPSPPVPAEAAVTGHEIVFARRPLALGEAKARGLAMRDDVHDLPNGAMHFAAGDPVCSVSAAGPHVAAVRRRLEENRDALLQALETAS